MARNDLNFTRNMKSPERKPRFPFRAFLCPCVALTWGAVPSTMAVRIRGICTPSRELGSPEQYRYSTSSPRSSIALPTRRIMVDFPAPGPPFRTIRSWWSSGSRSAGKDFCIPVRRLRQEKSEVSWAFLPNSESNSRYAGKRDLDIPSSRFPGFDPPAQRFPRRTSRTERPLPPSAPGSNVRHLRRRAKWLKSNALFPNLFGNNIQLSRTLTSSCFFAQYEV